MIRVVWTPPTEGASAPILPGYEGGQQRYFTGISEGHTIVYALPDDPRNARMLAALPPGFSIENQDPREAVMEKLRSLGIPHKRNEKMETLMRKLPG